MLHWMGPAAAGGRTPVVVGKTGEVAWIPFGELGEGFGVGREVDRVLKVEVAKSPWKCPV